MSAIDNIQKNIEEFKLKYCVDRPSQPIRWIRAIFFDDEDQIENILDFIKQSHISFIENEIERLELEKGTIKINLRKINEIERIESITIPQDYESSYFLGSKIALQKQIDYYKKTLELIKEI